MNLFQIALILIVACLLVAILWAMLKGFTTRREGMVWFLVWLAAGLAVAWPEVTGKVANALGIGRGADLVLYCAVLTMMLGFLMVYVRLRRLRRELTLLVRQLAIRDAISTPPSQHQEEAKSPEDA